MRMVSAKWREMPDTEKNTYEDKAVQHTILSVKRKRSKKKPRTKRPMNAYSMYVKDCHPKLKAENPDDTPTQIIKAISVQWKGLTDADKQPYKDRADEALEVYREQRKNDPESSSEEESSSDEEDIPKKGKGRGRDNDVPRRFKVGDIVQANIGEWVYQYCTTHCAMNSVADHQKILLSILYQIYT